MSGTILREQKKKRRRIRLNLYTKKVGVGWPRLDGPASFFSIKATLHYYYELVKKMLLGLTALSVRNWISQLEM